ncbi:MAG: TlpA family protein disulfide reductase [Spirochaetaceae bacterium]|jgi:peroxiredoxin|nr:TlpA family protein disulfide reductase [Spirochaetaceae bacterium]
MKKTLVLMYVVCLLLFPLEGQTGGISREVERAFAEANLPVVRQRILPPDFSLPLLGGGNISLSALKGKVVLLNFWATWCPPCRTEMPSMETLYRRFKNRNFEILAVDCAERTPDVQRFVRSNNYSFPVALDSSGEISSLYGITGLPTTYILDRDGRIIHRVVGSLDWNNRKIIAAIEVLLKSGT